MKITISLLSAAVAVTAAQPHRHAHQHGHHQQRDASPSADVVIVPGPTEVAYVLNGQLVSEDQVQEGLRNGTLQFTNGEGLVSMASDTPESSSSYVAPTTSSASIAPTSTSEAAWTPQWTPSAYSSTFEPSPSSSPAPTSSDSPAPAASSSSPSSSSNSGSDGSGSFDSNNNSGVESEFPDGELDCSTFPSEHGAVAVDWMGLGGWTGIQHPGSNTGGFSRIATSTSGTCTDGNCCTEGSYCSYACPAGYQKSQWPSTQGATGQSVGGILCQDGKLRLTNPGLSKNLCMTGASQVTVLVQNKLSENVAVCRTDYPGTEGETVPLNAQPGQTTNLTCPDADNYYNWQGSHTSAQYYVNPSGVSVQDACQWGSDANPWGNFAPLNLGVGYSNGAAWLSIFQNAPTTDAKLDFAVEITGDGMSGSCKYSNGQYCSGPNENQCSSTTGCTVSVTCSLVRPTPTQAD